jgi:hypothetical protein
MSRAILAYMDEKVILLIVWVAVAAVFAWFGIITYLLKYHWDKYALSEERIERAKRRYLQASGISAAGAVLFLLAYTVSVLL